MADILSLPETADVDHRLVDLQHYPQYRGVEQLTNIATLTPDSYLIVELRSNVHRKMKINNLNASAVLEVDAGFTTSVRCSDGIDRLITKWLLLAYLHTYNKKVDHVCSFARKSNTNFSDCTKEKLEHILESDLLPEGEQAKAALSYYHKNKSIGRPRKVNTVVINDDVMYNAKEDNSYALGVLQTLQASAEGGSVHVVFKEGVNE